LGYSWGGSGASFRIPDCRGMFPRGVSGSTNIDPDRNSRYAKYSGGASGNAVGSYQNFETNSHSHSESSSGNHSHSENSAGYHSHSESSAGYHSHSESSSGYHSHSESSAGSHSHTTSSDGLHGHDVSISQQGYYNCGDGSKQVRSRNYISGDPVDYSTHQAIYGLGAKPAGSHTHSLSNDGYHFHTIYSSGDHSHTINANGDHSHTINGSGDHSHTINSSGDHSHTIYSSGGNETRPSNFNINYVIKY
jgi:hypothetical protein